MKIEIREVKTKVSEAGRSFQLIRLQVVSQDGRKFWKEAAVPLSPDQVPYGPGRYEFSDSSFYVNRGQGVGFYPRLGFVAALDAVSGPSEGQVSSVVGSASGGASSASPARSGASSASWMAEIPF